MARPDANRVLSKFRGLRDSYRDYLSGGPWDPCEDSLHSLLLVLDAHASTVDSLIRTAVDNDALVPGVAGRRIERADKHHLLVERDYAQRIGAAKRKNEKYVRAAVHGTLDCAKADDPRPLPGFPSYLDIRESLTSTHDLVRRSGLTDGVFQKRRVKGQTRRFAKREVDRRIYLSAMVVANAMTPGVFPLSYALSSGNRVWRAAGGPRRVPEHLLDEWKARP